MKFAITTTLLLLVTIGVFILVNFAANDNAEPVRDDTSVGEFICDRTPGSNCRYP